MRANDKIAEQLGIEEALTGFEPSMSVFDRFELERFLGRSPVGVVWLALDVEMERRVALKIYPKVVLCDAAGLRQLKRAVEEVRRLRHSGIEALYELVENDDWFALVTEYVDGLSLRDRLAERDGGVFDIGELKEPIEQIVQALGHAHGEGVVHGKLTPGNIMLTADGVAKVSDFAVARIISDNVQRATRQSGAMGELPYLSPQQLDGENLKPSDDIYAMGVVVYELLTGRPPFYGGDLIWQIRNEPVVAIEDRRVEFGVVGEPVPRVWERMVMSCLSKHVEERPVRIQEVAPRRELAGSERGAKKSETSKGRGEAGGMPRKQVDMPLPLPRSRGGSGVKSAGNAGLASKRGAAPVSAEPRRTRSVGLLTLVSLLVVLALLGTIYFLNVFGMRDRVVEVVGVLWGDAEKSERVAAEQSVTGGGGVDTGDAVGAERSEEVKRALAALDAIRRERGEQTGEARGGAGGDRGEQLAGTEASAEVEPIAKVADVQPVQNGALASVSGGGAEVGADVEPDIDPESRPIAGEALGNAGEEGGGAGQGASLSEKIEQMFGEDLENLSSEEKAALDALRAAEKARIEAQEKLERARIKREAESRLAAHEEAIQSARDELATRQAAADEAAAALEEAKAAKKDRIGGVRDLMAESQQTQSAIAEIERSTREMARKLADLERQLAEQKTAYEEAQAKLEQARADSEKKMAEIAAVRENSAEMDARIERASEEFDRANQSLERASRVLAEKEMELEAMKTAVEEGDFDALPSDAGLDVEAESSAGAGSPPKAEPVEPRVDASLTGGEETKLPEARQVRVESVSGPSVAAIPPRDDGGGRFSNSLGMQYVPVGDVLFSVWETRLRDFTAFAESASHDVQGEWLDPGFEQAPDHPVVNVTWEDAMAFCEWLTERERGNGRISQEEYYRLPTDEEWSMAVGLEDEKGLTPETRDMDITGIYPWGTEWPPPSGAGNYTGEEAGSEVAIPGHDDGYAWTSPVGSFSPNLFGLYDMGGNAWEWCMDWWNKDQKQKVLRGASWYNGGLKLSLLSSCRVCSAPDSTTDNYGFRTVLVPSS